MINCRKRNKNVTENSAVKTTKCNRDNRGKNKAQKMLKITS